MLSGKLFPLIYGIFFSTLLLPNALFSSKIDSDPCEEIESKKQKRCFCCGFASAEVKDTRVARIRPYQNVQHAENSTESTKRMVVTVMRAESFHPNTPVDSESINAASSEMSDVSK